MHFNKVKLIIRNKVFTIKDLFVFYLLGLGIYSWTKEGIMMLLVSMILIGFSSFMTYAFFKRLIDRTAKIIIDQKGIDLIFEQKKYSWKNIDQAFLKTQLDGVGVHAQLVSCLHIKSSGSEHIYMVSNFRINKKKFERTIAHFLSSN